jgi:hypothetical protein
VAIGAYIVYQQIFIARQTLAVGELNLSLGEGTKF